MVEGRYFFPNQARFVPAMAEALPKRVIRISDEHGDVLAEGPAKKLKISSRLARLARRFDLPDGAIFETDDNDGADALLWSLRRRRRGKLTDRLERAWPVVGFSVIVSMAAIVYFAAQVVPQAAEWLAKETLPAVAHTMTEQTLFALDHTIMKASKMKPADQARATDLFQRVAKHARGGVSGYRLVFRSMKDSPNAFALPDGTIVMTDALWEIAQHEAEIEGVFAHEMSHVDHAHQLQRVYEASLFPAALAIFTGDISQISQMAAILPGLIAQSAYSRGFEQEADDDAAAILRAMGEKPSHMADLLARMDKKVCGKDGCPRSWIGGDHPETLDRIGRLHIEDSGPIDLKTECSASWWKKISIPCLGFLQP